MKRFYIAVRKDAQQDLAKILASLPDEIKSDVALDEPPAAMATRPSVSKDELDEIDRRIAELKKGAQVAKYLKMLGLRADQVGDFTYATVKVGVVPRTVRVGIVPSKVVKKFKERAASLATSFDVKPIDRRRSLLVIVAPIESRGPLLELLQELGFEELEIPSWLNPDPDIALREIDEEMKKLVERRIAYKIAEKCAYVADYAVVTGWAPKSVVKDLEKSISVLGDKLVYFGTEDPLPGDEVPVKLGYKGLLGKLTLITEMRGLPHYFEVDPTPIFAALYALMFGVMFGDVGGGLFLLTIGAVLMRKGNTLGKFGGLLAACGASATAFGLLYGSVFLNEELLKHFYEEVFHFTPLSPMHDYATIMAIALVFGAIQMFAAMTLSTINQFLWGDTVNLVTSRWGVPSLIYYASGIVLAVKFLQGGMNVAALTAPDALPFVGTCVAMLVLMMLSPLIKHYMHSKEISLVALIEGFGEVLEVFLSYITNSVSYVRLAAFAISHAALASAAVTLTASMGEIGAYLFMNGIAILIEGFAAGIQAMRLLYYEFSTKFYKGGGKPFEPITS